MSKRKKRLTRTMLRVVTADEQAFTHVLAAFQAMLKLGFTEENLSVGFFPRKDAPHTCIPSVVLQHDGRALTYRLIKYRLPGPQEKCEERWRAWLAKLVGQSREEMRLVMQRMYHASEFVRPSGQESIRQALEAAGIKPPLKLTSEQG